MKQLKILIGTLVLTAGSAGCTSAYYASAGSVGDDLYAQHDRVQIARKQQAKAEAEKAAAEARKAEWEARIAEAQAAAAENGYYEYKSNPYDDVLADSYESAYARRLRGFESPSYKMPSSYYNYRYSPTFTYVSAYDPAFYNIIVMGDQVWVEPKYITSMFGTWGSVVYADPWYYGWNRPWGPSFSIGSWGWSFGWNSWYNPWVSPWDPWYPWYSSWHNPWYGPGWGGGSGWGHGWHGHHWGGGHYPNRPGYGHRPNRPSTPTFGGGSSSRPSINRGSGGGKTWNSGVYQGNRNNRNNNRGGSSSSGDVSRPSRGSGSTSSGTTWNNSDRVGNRRGSSSGSSYSGGSSSSRSTGGYSGGSYSGGSSGGGSRSGSSTGSSSRSR